MRQNKIVTVAGFVSGFDQPWGFHGWVEVTQKAARELQREKAMMSVFYLIGLTWSAPIPTLAIASCQASTMHQMSSPGG